jgi:hypothetical protein
LVAVAFDMGMLRPSLSAHNSIFVKDTGGVFDQHGTWS